MKRDILQLILDCIKSQKESDLEEDVTIDETTLLIGRESGFGSLGLANLLISIEEKVFEQYKVRIDLVDENVLSKRISPLKDVNSLALFIQNAINS